MKSSLDMTAHISISSDPTISQSGWNGIDIRYELIYFFLVLNRNTRLHAESLQGRHRSIGYFLVHVRLLAADGNRRLLDLRQERLRLLWLLRRRGRGAGRWPLNHRRVSHFQRVFSIIRPVIDGHLVVSFIFVQSMAERTINTSLDGSAQSFHSSIGSFDKRNYCVYWLFLRWCWISDQLILINLYILISKFEGDQREKLSSEWRSLLLAILLPSEAVSRLVPAQFFVSLA